MHIKSSFAGETIIKKKQKQKQKNNNKLKDEQENQKKWTSFNLNLADVTGSDWLILGHYPTRNAHGPIKGYNSAKTKQKA